MDHVIILYFPKLMSEILLYEAEYYRNLVFEMVVRPSFDDTVILLYILLFINKTPL